MGILGHCHCEFLSNIISQITKPSIKWNLPQPLTPPPPPYKFPQPDLLWHLINIYFTETAPYFPLIHGPTFKRAVSSGLHLLDHNFGAVLLAVIAIAARSSEDPRVLLHDTRLTAGWQWFRQIRLLRPNLYETTCVHELQLYCVRSLTHGMLLLIEE